MDLLPLSHDIFDQKAPITCRHGTCGSLTPRTIRASHSLLVTQSTRSSPEVPQLINWFKFALDKLSKAHSRQRASIKGRGLSSRTVFDRLFG